MSKLTKIDGLPIVDAKRPLKIVVKRCDLKGSDPKQPMTCAIAQACRRELHPQGIMVHLSRIYINTDNKKWVRYQTPADARSEIVAFDRGGAFEPGEFVFNPPRPSKRLTGKRFGGNKPTYNKTGRTRTRPYKLTPNVRAHA